jgi:hypothetical protein
MWSLFTLGGRGSKTRNAAAWTQKQQQLNNRAMKMNELRMEKPP